MSRVSNVSIQFGSLAEQRLNNKFASIVFGWRGVSAFCIIDKVCAPNLMLARKTVNVIVDFGLY